MISQSAGFEPARGDPIGFQVQRLNHSATAASYIKKLISVQFKILERNEEEIPSFFLLYHIKSNVVHFVVSDMTKEHDDDVCKTLNILLVEREFFVGPCHLFS